MKIKWYIIVLILLILPTTAKAQEFVSIDCNNEDNEYTCLVYGVPEYPIRAIEFRYSLPNYVDDSSFTFEENIFGRLYDNRAIALLEELTDQKVLIGTLMINTNSNLNVDDIIISDIKVVNADYEDVIISNSENNDENDNENNDENDKENSLNWLKFIIPGGILIVGIIVLIIIKVIGGKNEKN